MDKEKIIRRLGWIRRMTVKRVWEKLDPKTKDIDAVIDAIDRLIADLREGKG